MGKISTAARSAFRTFALDGVPASGVHEPVKSEIVATFALVDDRLETVEAAQASGILGRATWAQLSAIAGTANGVGKVYGPDAATHTDPVVGGTVSNVGVYRYSTSPAGWERIANLETEDAAASAAAAEEASAELRRRLTIGSASAPVAGAPVAGQTWIEARTLKRRARLIRIEARTSDAGDMTIRRWDRDRGEMEADGAALVVALASGANDISSAAGDFEPITFEPDEMIGFHATTIDFTFTPGVPFFQANFNVTTMDSSVFSATLQPEVRFTFDYASVDGEQIGRRLARSSPVAAADWVHVLAYGQSNSIGADANPALTTTPSAYHKTFGVGPKMTKPSITGGANADDLTVKALVEDNVLPALAGAAGETHLSALCRSYTQRAMQRVAGVQTLFASTAGSPGTGITGIWDDADWYENVLYHVEAGLREATEVSETYAVGTVTFDHGETDQQNGMGRAEYKGRLNVLLDNLSKDVVALTGQSDPPIFLCTQPPYYIAASSGASDALLDLAEERDDFHFVAPGYRFPYANATHLSNVGQILKGHYYGRAMDQVAQGLIPDRVYWLNAVASGTSLTIYAKAPTALQISTAIRSAATNNGFAVIDGTGTLTLSAIAVSEVGKDADGYAISAVTMTLNRTLGADPAVHYGKHHLGAGMTINNGASGNIFDTTDETVTIAGTDYPLVHAAPPVTLPILLAE